MEQDFKSKKIKIALLIVGTGITVYLLFRYALLMFVPFILAYFFTKLLRPVVNWLYKKIHMLKMISTTILLVILVGIIGTLLFFLGKKLIGQISSLISNISVYEDYMLGGMRSVGGYLDRMIRLEDGQAYDYMYQNSNEDY